MTRKLLLDASILLGLAVLGGVGYQLAPLIAPKTDLALPLSNCKLDQQACTATLPDGGRIEFSIAPRPIPVLKPLQLQATITGSEVHKVFVDLAGSSMMMGYNRPQLARAAEHSGRFVGEAMLPVCITGSMEWEATLMLDTGRGVVAVPFRFIAGH